MLNESISILKTSTSKSRLIWYAAYVSLLIWSGCTPSVASEEAKRSDIPVTVDQARERLGIRLPLPENAKNVRYLMFGRTQSWHLYLSFQASLHDIDDAISQEFALYTKLNAVAGVFPSEKYRKQSITSSISSSAKQHAPTWWRPSQITDGYYIGSAHPYDYGPHFWVDTTTKTAFYFQRF